jgi:hypothetical protein
MQSHFIYVGDQRVPLPSGVTVAQWSEERTQLQNPRIRAFLGCIHMLGSVMESNYALLHCSPERLIEIWRKVREVTELMLEELAPLLEVPSRLPRLEEARYTAKVALEMLQDTVIEDLLALPGDEVDAEQMLEVRKLLCISIGKLHNFLQDAFGQVMAADPRSQHDADYFLSKRFPQDVEEAEWLHSTVAKLRRYLRDLDTDRVAILVPTRRLLHGESTLPTVHRWSEVQEFLMRLVKDFTPRLREVLALRGIRFHEMEILDRYSAEIPFKCGVVLELFAAGRKAVDRVRAETSKTLETRVRGVLEMEAVHAATTERMVELMVEIDASICDLVAFVPLWLDGIEMRRALLLKRTQGIGSDESGDGTDPDDEAEAEGWSRRRSAGASDQLDDTADRATPVTA